MTRTTSLRSKRPQKAILRLPGAKKRRKKSDLSKLKEKLWQLCRQLIIKQHGTDCYTCPSRNLAGSGLHIGHFIPSSVCSTRLRYCLTNLRPQCYACNIHRSGNWLAYERHLIRDGVDVAVLKQQNGATTGLSYRNDWYETKITEYQALLDSLA
jgi:5-methylcytosine-specific restriction endonuclease McrA